MHEFELVASSVAVHVTVVSPCWKLLDPEAGLHDTVTAVSKLSVAVGFVQDTWLVETVMSLGQLIVGACTSVINEN